MRPRQIDSGRFTYNNNSGLIRGLATYWYTICHTTTFQLNEMEPIADGSARGFGYTFFQRLSASATSRSLVVSPNAFHIFC